MKTIETAAMIGLAAILCGCATGPGDSPYRDPTEMRGRKTDFSAYDIQQCADGAAIPAEALQDALVASLGGSALAVVNPQSVIGTVQNRTALGEAMPVASAQALARQVGAEGFVTASVLEFAKVAIGNPPVGFQLKTRLSLTLADAATGASVCGVTVSAKGPQMTLAQFATGGAEAGKEVLHAAAESAARQLAAKVAAANWTPGRAGRTKVFFGCNVLGADVQIDGMSYGTCPAQIDIEPGPHNLVVSYPPYYLPFARRAMFTGGGQTFAVVLQTTPEGEKSRRSGELFEKQKALFDAQLGRFKDAGKTEDDVRRMIAEGTAVYWKNSYGRIVITDGTAENIEFTTPVTDTATLQDAPSSAQIGKKLQDLLEGK